MHPWEQIEGESAKAYQAFAKYRDAGPSRSLDACYRGAGSKQRGVRRVSGRAPGCWTKWSVDHDWAARAQAYDAHCDALQREARERGLGRLAERRLDFELAHQERLERSVGSIDELLQRALRLPLVDSYTAKGKKKGLNWMWLAKLLSQQQALALDAILGVRPPSKEDSDAAGFDAALNRLLEARKRISE